MKRLFVTASLMIAVMMVCGGVSLAQDEALDLGKVLVTATKTEKEIRNVAASVEVITLEQIQASAADNIDDLIGQYAGVYAEREQGFLEWKGSVTLRGMDTNDGRTLVLVDGMLLNNGESGAANFNTISLDNVERVEIVRGPGSTLYGTDALGGVINIITKKAQKEFQGKLSTSAGSLNTYREKMDLTGGIGDLDLLLTVDNMRSGGFNQAIPANQVAGAEDTTVEEQHFFLKAVDNIGNADTTLTFTAAYYDDERHQGEIEARAANPDGNMVSFDSQRYQFGFSNPGEKYSANFSGFYNMEAYERLWDRGGGSKEVRVDRLNYGIDTNATWKFNRHELTVGGGYAVADQDGVDDYFYDNNTNAVTTDPNDDAQNQGQIDTMSIYINDMLYLNDKLDMELGLRFDDSSLEDAMYKFSEIDAWRPTASTAPVYLNDKDWSELSPRVAFNYYTGQNSKMRVSYARSFHAPVLEYLTLTMPRSGGNWLYRSNPNLDAEEIDTYELGFDHMGKRYTMGLNFFYSDATNFIDYMSVGADMMAMNVGKVVIKGIEWENSIQAYESTRGYFNLSWTKAEYDEYLADTRYEGQELTDVPAFMGNVGMEYSRPKDESYSLNLKYVGTRYEYDRNILPVTKKAYFTADVSAAKWLDDDIRCSLNIRNIFKPTEVVTSGSDGRYQQPGVLWTLGAEYHF